MRTIDIKLKICSKCKEEKSIEEFYKHKGLSDGLHSECKICGRKYERIRYAKHKELKTKYYKNKPESMRKHSLFSKFGLSIEQYDDLLNQQNNNCAICLKHQSVYPRRLAVDHDHKTGKIRGLLCDSCNRAIGFLKDSIENARNLLNYLERN